MKKVFFIPVLLALFLIACQQERKSFNKSDEISKIESVLEQYVIANESKDFSLIEKIWATDDDIVLIGTDANEKLIGWKQIKNAIKRQFSEFEDTYIAVIDQNIRINESGNTAWFSEFLNYNFIYQEDARSFEGIRFTGVLEKRDGQWVLVQGHLSIPVSKAAEMVKRES